MKTKARTIDIINLVIVCTIFAVIVGAALNSVVKYDPKQVRKGIVMSLPRMFK